MACQRSETGSASFGPLELFWKGKSRIQPKSEIETGNLTQSLGHKRIEKISTDHFGYASIFSIRFCSKILRHLAGLNFGIRFKRISKARRPSTRPEERLAAWSRCAVV